MVLIDLALPTTLKRTAINNVAVSPDDTLAGLKDKIIAAAGLSPLLTPAIQISDTFPLTPVGGTDGDPLLKLIDVAVDHKFDDEGRNVEYTTRDKSMDVVVDLRADGQVDVLRRSKKPVLLSGDETTCRALRLSTPDSSVSVSLAPADMPSDVFVVNDRVIQLNPSDTTVADLQSECQIRFGGQVYLSLTRLRLRV